MAQLQPIIIKKVTKGHAAHHGGAWKVAFADFMTAMMAFFLVMWIVGMNDEVKASIQGYFQDPAGFTKSSRGSGSPLMGGNNLSIGNPSTHNRTDMSKEEEVAERNQLKTAKQHLEKQLQDTPSLQGLTNSVTITLDNDGLRIELLEGPQPRFFALGCAETKPATVAILSMVAREIGKLQNRITLEGHTDRRPYSSSSSMTNWELSTDRANAARRIMVARGLHENQIAEVRGYADQKLRMPSDPFHYSNRRVTILVKYEQFAGQINLRKDVKENLKQLLPSIAPNLAAGENNQKSK
ncbi:MAG: flagellar motor protein MotB [bacterium]